MIIKFAISFLFLVSLNSFSTDFGTLIVERVNSVYDGDTFRADIQGLHPIIGQNISIRVSGADTPEIRGKCDQEKVLAKQAREHTRSFLENGQVIELRNIKRGKYFRIVADVWVDGKSLTQSLLNANLAYEYQGGKKLSWCE